MSAALVHRIDTCLDWLACKPRWARAAAVLALAPLVLAPAQGYSWLVGTPNPFDLPKTDVIDLHCWLLLIVIVSAFVMRKGYGWRPYPAPDPPMPALHVYEIAFLTHRVAETVITHLLIQGNLDFYESLGTVGQGVPLEADAHPLERLIYQAAPSVPLAYDLRFPPLDTYVAITRDLAARLRNNGLLVDGHERRWRRTIPMVLVLSVAVSCAAFINMAISRQRPIIELWVVAFVALIVALGLGPSPHRTRYGDRVLLRLRERGLESLSPEQKEMPPHPVLAVALTGVGALAGTELDLFGKAMVPSD